MALTDEQIEEIWKNHVLPGFGENQRFYSPHVYGRAIESAACAERDARIAELEQENAKLKTVPMKYRRMAFNAELQEKIAELERQLAEARKDAERYRWLRDWPEWEPFDSSWLIRENIYGCPALEMDAAIDNAMQKG